MNFTDKVKELVNNALNENNHLFLIDLSVSNDNSVKVVVDGDNGVTINDCIAISRAIEHNLDREEEDFSIEVTSYGATEPLLTERQYRKNIGRNVKIKLEGEKHEGILKSCENSNVILETKTKEPKPVGKGKVTVIKEHTFAIENIKEAKVIIKF